MNHYRCGSCGRGIFGVYTEASQRHGSNFWNVVVECHNPGCRRWNGGDTVAGAFAAIASPQDQQPKEPGSCSCAYCSQFSVKS